MAPAAKKSNQNPSEPVPEGLVGNSDVMQAALRLLNQASKVDTPVLLLGETGTGKSVLASVIHQQSSRSQSALLSINCQALTEVQLEHQLFGHGLSGSLFELAHEGTLIIHDVQALPPRLQTRLLGYLETGYFERPGEMGAIGINVRIIAATDQDLGRWVTEGKFREDLFWRLSVLTLAVPPLRRRGKDLQQLVEQILKSFAEKHQKAVTSIDPAALKALQDYHWPGNLRELQNYLERAVILATSNQLTIDLLPQAVVGDTVANQSAVFRPTDEQSLIREYVYHRISKSPADAADLYQQIVEPVEKELISQIMEACQHTQTKAAARLGINRNTLYKKLVELGLTKPSEESA